MKVILYFFLLIVFCCGVSIAQSDIPDPSKDKCATKKLPNWTFSDDMIFPDDRSLMRPEDGVVLPDSRLIVSDQAYGLRQINEDGTNKPFGKFSEAGYVHQLRNNAGGANGVTLEPAGTHIIVADVYQGGIYRVNVDTEETELLYQHQFGVNMARRDSRGGLWFSQSARNSPEAGKEELRRATLSPRPDGAVYYLPPDAIKQNRAILVADSLYFSNGIALDEEGEYFYVAETMASRILRYRMNLFTGQLSDPSVVFEIPFPDNIEIDHLSRLWIAGYFRNEVVVLNPDTGISETVFRIKTPRSEELLKEIEKRVGTGEPIYDLLGPGLWEPSPGPFTGIILSPDCGNVYVSNSGNALIKLER